MTEERDRITDPKLIFYLERRKQIDEWALLQNLEKATAIEFVRSLQPDIQAVAGELEPDLYVDNFMLEGAEHIAVWRPSWLAAPSGEEGPLPQAMVAIAWYKTIRFEGAGLGPFVGLRVRSSQHVELRRSLGQLVTDGGIGGQAFPAGTPLGRSTWVRYRSISVTSERYWEDLGPYRKELVGAVAEAWRHFADVVDVALQSTD